MAREVRYKKLRGRIIGKYGTLGNFAEALFISYNTVSLRLNGKINFSKDDMEKWGSLLDIPQEEYLDYFFELESEE